MPRERDEPDYQLGRWIAIAVCTILVPFCVLIDSLGRLFIDDDFHVSEILFGTLVLTWLVLLGLEGIDRLRGRGP